MVLKGFSLHSHFAVRLISYSINPHKYLINPHSFKAPSIQMDEQRTEFPQGKLLLSLTLFC